jgi:hypothetical protein
MGSLTISEVCKNYLKLILAITLVVSNTFPANADPFMPGDDNNWDQNIGDEFDDVDDVDDIDDNESYGVDLLEYAYEVEYLCNDKQLSRKSCSKVSKALIELSKNLYLIYDDPNYEEEIKIVASDIRRTGRGGRGR